MRRWICSFFHNDLMYEEAKQNRTTTKQKTTCELLKAFTFLVAAKMLFSNLYFTQNEILFQTTCQYCPMALEIVSILSKEVYIYEWFLVITHRNSYISFEANKEPPKLQSESQSIQITNVPFSAGAQDIHTLCCLFSRPHIFITDQSLVSRFILVFHRNRMKALDHYFFLLLFTGKYFITLLEIKVW